MKVTINGKKEVLDISIKKEFEDITELEDLLVITLNSAIMEAEELAAKEANNLLESMLPGGLGSLFG
ncbi:MAG: YbaB/EbfC family nucleoid-associated protein [Saprospiraceae bacterium]